MHAHAHAVGALGGGRRSPMSLMPNLVAWWEPGKGMTTSEGSAPNPYAQDLWMVYPVATAEANTTETLDPDGGNAAEKITFGTVGSAIYEATTNHVAGPGVLRLDVKRASGDASIKIRDGSGAAGATFNLTTGVSAVYGLGTTCSMTNLGNGWWRCEVYAENLNSASAYIAIEAVGAGVVYAYGGVARQHRCSALADQSGHGYHLSQSTAASQPFVQKVPNGSSPGGNLWANHAAIWQPKDSAKIAVCTEAGLCTAMTTDHTFVADVYITAAATAAVPLFATAGGVAIVYGIDTSRRPYGTCGTTLTGTALAVGRHRIAFVRSGNTWSIYADGAIDGVPTVLTPGGAISPTSVTLTQRCMGFRAGGLSGVAMNILQIAAEHAALLGEAP